MKTEKETGEFVELVKDDTEQKIGVEDLRILFESKMETLSSTWVFLLGIGFLLVQASSLSANATVIDAFRYLFTETCWGLGCLQSYHCEKPQIDAKQSLQRLLESEGANRTANALEPVSNLRS